MLGREQVHQRCETCSRTRAKWMFGVICRSQFPRREDWESLTEGDHRRVCWIAGVRHVDNGEPVSGKDHGGTAPVAVPSSV